ncbi:MAG TPA: hypothetical protein VHK90_07770 [Thermoanaerobaculia bacterium]|nr:hypothetical protein [Thermoanaerobaculia bacterium]
MCLLATVAFAQQPEVKQPDSGMQAAVDEHGQLRQPTPEEMKALTAVSQARPARLLIPQVTSQGISITLDESFDHMYVVRTDDDGNFVFTCTDDHSAASAFVAKTAAIETILRIKPAQPMRARIAERE